MDISRPVNPFVVAGSIPDHLFCDRETESDRLVRELTNGNNLVLLSQRRMGKTGLLMHCFQLPAIKENYETFYLDILQTSSLKEFTYLFGREIFRRLAPKSVRLVKQFAAVLKSIAGGFGFDPISGSPTFNLQLGDISNPELTIDEIFRFLAEAEVRSLVAIDEFQQITQYKEKNVEAILRSHIQRIPNCNFVFAGSERHLLTRMFTESAKPFYNSASFLELNAIDPGIYEAFASRLFYEYGKRLGADVVKSVWELFEGNTFYLQKTFNLAFSMTRERDACNHDIVTHAVYDMLASFDTIYRQMLSNISEHQKLLLLAIAREKQATGITSARFLKQYALPSASSVQASVKKLSELSLISREGSITRIQDSLMRLWLLLTYGNETLGSYLREAGDDIEERGD